ncbi:unnamed protein product [Notodromas monacha]|uniref:Uncharacterized protein n=1 Tax=Notodromas monacha TaxID=399045 RepID=A0A7R9GE93_9CRUS|nr:unnamed protein product [Notodromas monacha]CAG0918021.1 unnamed protein product [Notodromas monacha]
MSEVTEETLMKLKVVELRAELSQRKLPTQGTKAILVDRLLTAIQAEVQENGDEAEEQTTNGDMESIGVDEAASESMETSQEILQPVGDTSKEDVTVAPVAPVPAKSPEAPVPAESPEAPGSVPLEDTSSSAPKEAMEEPAVPCANIDEVSESVPSTTHAPSFLSDGPKPTTAHEQEKPSEEQESLPVEEVQAELSQQPKEEVQEPDQVCQTDPEGTSVKTEADHVEAKSEVEKMETDAPLTEATKVEEHSIKEEKPAVDEKLDQSRISEREEAVIPLVIPEFDETKVLLDWCMFLIFFASNIKLTLTPVLLADNSDLHLAIDKDNLTLAAPLNEVPGFGYVWAGARATYGFTKGKIFYEAKLLEHLVISGIEDEPAPHVLRVGWSVDSPNCQLGEDPLSYGYGGTGKSANCGTFADYGVSFSAGNVIGAYIDLDANPITMSFTVDGADQGVAFNINRDDLSEKPLFPHVLSKNVKFEVNFGDRADGPYFQHPEQLLGHVSCAEVALEDRVRGPLPPEKKEDCELLMMVGLPSCGKTTWANKYSSEHPDKKFNVLSTNFLLDRMKVMGLAKKRNYAGRWEVLIEKSTKCLNVLLRLAGSRLRNYIIDQTNVYPSARRRKLKSFEGFATKAIVIVPTDDEYKKRQEKVEKEEGKDVPDTAVMDMKANFTLPKESDVGEIVFVELDREEAQKIVDTYNKEGKEANARRSSSNQGGSPAKRFRSDGRDDRRNDSRDRDRRSNDYGRRDDRGYQGRGGSWRGGDAGRGGGGGGWNNYNRDRWNGRSGGGGDRGWRGGGDRAWGGDRSGGMRQGYGGGDRRNDRDGGRQGGGGDRGGGYGNRGGGAYAGGRDFRGSRDSRGRDDGRYQPYPRRDDRGGGGGRQPPFQRDSRGGQQSGYQGGSSMGRGYGATSSVRPWNQSSGVFLPFGNSFEWRFVSFMSSLVLLMKAFLLPHVHIVVEEATVVPVEVVFQLEATELRLRKPSLELELLLQIQLRPQQRGPLRQERDPELLGQLNRLVSLLPQMPGPVSK